MANFKDRLRVSGSGLRVLKWVGLGLTTISVILFVYSAALLEADYLSSLLVFSFIAMVAFTIVTAILFWADARAR